MDDMDINKLLAQLEREIERTQRVDEKGQELLRELSKDIQDLLERSGSSPRPSVIRRLEESVEHFEATHPRLTTMLSELLTSLSNAGI